MESNVLGVSNTLFFQHLFRCSDPAKLMNTAVEAAALYLGLILNRSPSPLTVDWCRETRLGPMVT